MNILELDSYNLADAVKFNDKLNPRIWDGEKMRPEVRSKLLEIAADFKESLGLNDLDVEDITVSGSNAGYTYTPHSDIDLHLVVRMPEQCDDVYQELFNAKKYQYNNEHDIKIGGYDVELYVQPSDQEHVSAGVYSLKNNDWIHIPRKIAATADDAVVKDKYDLIKSKIDSALKSKDIDRMKAVWDKIKEMRKAGLAKNGELGPENLTFKMLRTQGDLGELKDTIRRARDAELSLAEQNKEKKPFVYGYKNVVDEDVTATPDGVGASTRMFLSEKPVPPHEEIIKNFIRFARNEIGLKKLPKFKLHKSPDWSVEHQSFGRYTNDTDTIDLAIGDRHIMDILRTLAHELQHRVQDERETMPPDAGETGSPYENEAHAVAGVLMRKFADMHPEYFEDVPVAESASGYIPKNKKEAQDPRYAMALTVDIKPGQTGKEANKMALKTDKQGKPELLIKSANLLKEYQEFKQGLLEDQDLFEIKMTGKNLAKLASDIKGVKVGLEFEMIVPNATVDDDGDMEPDYDEDERVRDIDDCVSFFDDGDYNGRNEIRRLRSSMESDFFDWQIEQLDQAWHNDGFEFFQEYLDREEPFDRDEALEEAEDYVRENNPDIEPGTDEYSEAVSERLNEMEANYAVQQWEDQGVWYDRAREEFDDEQRDNFSESDWLSDQDIRYASDVQNNYGDVTWPYYRSNSSEGEADIERIALEFMNDSGLPYKSVAVSSSYHGSYKKWNGSEWVNVGSNKPDDCFSIEPDGSLDGNSSDDVGLEFVSPPIPLEQVGDVMSKVQKWAGENGVYTGKDNKTSMHTNISIPGYDLDKLDYLKAALLLGDEHVLRQFDRIGNSYAKPAIDKVKQLARDKPEKTKELLDKMKSQLDAAASKILHTGITDKFTSINTKDNRIEFRSPGGDYLSDIADNPKKMQDTINRMVVAMDAAMDPDKYKQEYQKKLYKVLTGDIGSRKAKTGEQEWTVKSKANVWDKDTRQQRPAFSLKVEAKTAKDAWKALKSMLPPGAIESEYTITPNKLPTPGNKDLLNIFSRYAAGEMPKAALKSFLKQAQLQRKMEKDPTGGQKYWWNVKLDGQRVEVVATNKREAFDAALDTNPEWMRYNINQAEITPLRPYEEKPEASQQGSGLYKIFDTRGTLIAGDEYGSDRAALARAGVWAMQRGVDVVVKNAQGEEIGRVSSSGEITPTAQQQGTTVAGRPNNPDGDWYLKNGDTNEIFYRFNAADYADAYGVLQQWKQENPDSNINALYGRVSVEPAQQSAPIPGSTLDLQRQRAAQAQQPAQQNQGNWGIWIIGNNRFANQPGTYARGADVPLYRFPSQEAAESWLEQQRAERAGLRTDIEVREIEPTRTPVTDIDLFPDMDADLARSRADDATRRGETEYIIFNMNDRSQLTGFRAANQAEAEREAESILRDLNLDPDQYDVRERNARPIGSQQDNWSQDFERRMQQGDAAQGGIVDVAGSEVGQTYNPTGTGSFTGQWLVLDPNNRVIYRFGGIGNSQSDANRHAMNWLTQNPREMVDGVTVVPEMG